LTFESEVRFLEGDSFDLFYDQLSDGHARLEDESRRPEIKDLQRQRTIKTWVNRRGGEVDKDPAPRDAAPALNPGGQARTRIIIDLVFDWQREILESDPENEL